MDRPKRQTATATPAKPGGLPLTLAPYPPEYLAETLSTIKEIDPDYLVPLHCTGEPFFDGERRTRAESHPSLHRLSSRLQLAGRFDWLPLSAKHQRRGSLRAANEAQTVRFPHDRLRASSPRTRGVFAWSARLCTANRPRWNQQDTRAEFKCSASRRLPSQLRRARVGNARLTSTPAGRNAQIAARSPTSKADSEALLGDRWAETKVLRFRLRQFCSRRIAANSFEPKGEGIRSYDAAGLNGDAGRLARVRPLGGCSGSHGTGSPDHISSSGSRAGRSCRRRRP